MTDQLEANRQAAQRWLEAEQLPDLDAIYATYTDDAKIWINVTGETYGLHEYRKGEFDLFDSLHFTDVKIHPIEGGFVSQQRAEIDLPNGTHLSVPFCAIAQLRDGLIYMLEEYFDSAPTANALKELGLTD